MIRGLYTAAAGMTTEMVQNNVCANNLANIDTVGYKKDITVNRSFSEMLIHRINDHVYQEKGFMINSKPFIGVLGTGVQVNGLFTSYEQGALKETRNPLDLAIGGEGFFVIGSNPGTPREQRFYTRNGAFKVNSEGILCDGEGRTVLGTEGIIRMPRDAKEIIFGTDGEIFADGNRVGQLNLVGFADTGQLEKVGEHLLRIKDGAQVQEQIFSGNVQQGFLEASNVNPVQEMVKMITSLRSYEANQKVIQANDETVGKAVNEVGRIG